MRDVQHDAPLRKALLVHPDLAVLGGAEAYALALERELCRSGYEVDRFDVASISAHAESYLLKLMLRVAMLGNGLALLKYALVLRELPRAGRDYDLVVYSYGEGREVDTAALLVCHAPALFSTDAEALEWLGVDTRGRLSLCLRRLYVRFCRALVGGEPTFRVSDRQRTVANSRWTAERLPRSVDDVRVLYPKVEALQPRPDIERLPLEVMTLGRLVRNKRLEDVIEACGLLQGRGLRVRLNILGSGNGPYVSELTALCRQHEWISLEVGPSRERIADVAARCSFGVHAYRHEHFGIAVAEMISAGCLPLVFDGGGVAELVANSVLRFSDVASAANSLQKLIEEDRALLERLRRELRFGDAMERALAFDAEVARLIDELPIPGLEVAE